MSEVSTGEVETLFQITSEGIRGTSSPLVPEPEPEPKANILEGLTSPTPYHPEIQRIVSGEPERKYPKETEKNFPWDTVGEKQTLGLTVDFTTILVGKNINVGMGVTNRVITKNLTLGAGYICKAIVFEKITITLGRIDELFCTALTIIDNTFGSIGHKTILTENELNNLAIKESGSELGVLPPSNTLNWNAFSSSQRVTLSRETKLAARKVELLSASAQSVIAKDFNISAGYVKKAFVFDSLSLNMGIIEVLFCTPRTTITVGLSTIRNKIVLSHEDLLRIAMQEYNMP